MRTLHNICCMVVVCVLVASCGERKADERLKPAQGFLASLDTANYTIIEWKDSIQNFGNVQEGNSVKLAYTFKNVGTKPLFLSKVHAACGCTVVTFPKEAILPAHEEKLVVNFSTLHHPGYAIRAFEVISNTTNNTMHVLKMEGNVIKNTKK
jgi:hypothetical protein